MLVRLEAASQPVHRVGDMDRARRCRSLLSAREIGRGCRAMSYDNEQFFPSRHCPDRLWQYAPGTVLRDDHGSYWMVRNDGETAVGTNGGVMVDLTRGEPIFSPGINRDGAAS